MITNYLKIAWRNLIRQKLFSIINITGLAVGLAACMMILFYVTHELSYNSFHKDAKNIFIVNDNYKYASSAFSDNHISYVSASLLQESDPGIKSYTHTRHNEAEAWVALPESPDRQFSEDKVLFADANFFSFFTFPLQSGNAANVLAEPFTAVITEQTARKYFPGIDPVGMTLKIRSDSAFYLYKITGIAKNAPSNSTINFDFVLSISSMKNMPEIKNIVNNPYMGGGSFFTYLYLNDPAETLRLTKASTNYIRRNPRAGNESFTFTPLTDIHLKNSNGSSANLKYIKIFPLVAGLILLLALVNYISLSTARSSIRAKEVGVRKVSGAGRKTIALQFYIEAALFTSVSFLIGYILCLLLKGPFLNFLQLRIDDDFFCSPVVLSFLAGMLLLTVLIAGSYPSIVLSAFKPVLTLKGKISKQTGGVALRKFFTTLQFVISISLIICGIVIDRQLYFFRHTDIGLNRENVVMVPIKSTFGKQYQSFKKDVESLAGISRVGTSSMPMFKGIYGTADVKGKGVSMPVMYADKNLLQVLNIKWKTPEPASVAVVGKMAINETAARRFDLPANPAGSFIDFGWYKTEVSGVVRDFNFASLHAQLSPLAIEFVADTNSEWGVGGGCLFAKIKPNVNTPGIIGAIEKSYKRYDKKSPFTYTFLDDAFNQQYKAEDRLASIFSVFTFITIILATLGLFGLAAFTIEQRTKEIGIRKVLGASLASINTLLSRDFLALVVLSIVIASPIAWWAMRKWLQGFAYRINIQWWMFAAAGIIAVVTAVVTVSYHAIKAGIANPVDSLRSE